MRSLKKIMVITLASIFFLSTSPMAHAETNQETLSNNQSKLQQQNDIISKKEAEKKTVLNELNEIHNELAKLNKKIAENKKIIATLENDIDVSHKKIEEKKEEIVVLEDKVLSRKDIMKDRLVTLQHNDQTNFLIEILLESENFSQFLDRAAAVTTIFTMDKDILEQQEDDLQKIEKEKEDIKKEEESLQEQYQKLATNQQSLEASLQKSQNTIASVQEKYNKISKDITLAKSEKAAIESNLKKEQEQLKQQQQEAEKRKEQLAQETKEVTSNIKTPSVKDSSGSKVLYVTATAYSHQDTSSDHTATGINIRINKNMKLIAVDPSVIPLGKRVWVEGYGEAIAGDTGGAIKGHKIDVLMPSSAKARSWGRQTVKVIILN